MTIAGLVVHALPRDHGKVRETLAELPGVEVHNVTEDGRLVVTVEDVDGTDPGAVVLDIHKIAGVLSAALVFHHFEDDDADAPPPAPQIKEFDS
ncbi:MAG: chaperone NapD [Hyphomicrobiales bacterium]|nr:chaperone NapD [Hyphomicrobiales bacterium]